MSDKRGSGPAVPGSEEGGRQGAPGTGKGGSASPWSLQKERSLADTLILAPEHLFWTSDFQNWNLMNCVMPPGLWDLVMAATENNTR